MAILLVVAALWLRGSAGSGSGRKMAWTCGKATAPSPVVFFQDSSSDSFHGSGVFRFRQVTTPSDGGKPHGWILVMCEWCYVGRHDETVSVL